MKTAVVGDIVGFDVKLRDVDEAEEEISDQITWVELFDQGWNNPSLWGEIELLENGYVAALTVRPAVPGGLATAVENDSVVTVTWSEVADAVAYNLYRDGTMVGDSVEELTFTETLSPGDEDMTYAYAIRSIDADDMLSNISGAKEVTILASTIRIDHHVIGNVSVYPNPATEVLNIQSDEQIESVNIMSMSGQIIETMSVNAFNTMIDISNVKSGIYIVNVKLNDYSQNYRIIVR